MSKPVGLVTVAMSAAFLAMGMKEYADFVSGATGKNSGKRKAL